MAEALHCRSSGIFHEPRLAELSPCQAVEWLAPEGDPLQAGHSILCSPAQPSPALASAPEPQDFMVTWQHL